MSNKIVAGLCKFTRMSQYQKSSPATLRGRDARLYNKGQRGKGTKTGHGVDRCSGVQRLSEVQGSANLQPQTTVEPDSTSGNLQPQHFAQPWSPAGQARRGTSRTGAQSGHGGGSGADRTEPGPALDDDRTGAAGALEHPPFPAFICRVYRTAALRVHRRQARGPRQDPAGAERLHLVNDNYSSRTFPCF